ncbi:MAG: excisionase [Anaerocolumna sp.]
MNYKKEVFILREFTLMNKNTPVLKFELDIDTAQIYKITKVQNPEYAPISVLDSKGIPNKAYLVDWWKDRAIPVSRSGLREALQLMNITNTEKLMLKSYGLSLSDQYWICEVGSDLQWANINFFANDFSDDVGEALFGRQSSEQLNLLSPCNTSDGWLKKKWKIINTKRTLLKAGSGESLQEPLNEMISTRILDMSTISNYVKYYLLEDKDGKPLSACENFITPNTELITAWNVMKVLKKNNSDNEYTHYLKCCDHLGISVEEFMSDMLTFDYLICNQDRHYNNFGVIRDVNTLKVLGPAPIFDNGTSIWNGTATSFINHTVAQESKPFRKEHSEQIKLIRKSAKFDIPNIDTIVKSIMSLSPYVEQNRIEKISTSLSQRFRSFYN